MAITTSINFPNVAVRIATGAYIDTGTAAAINLECGFTPRFVIILNETGGHIAIWNETMADAEALVLSEDGGTTDLVMVTSDGITPYSTDFFGFTFGLDSDMNVQNEQVSWIAFG